jgi:hypothetical protein
VPLKLCSVVNLPLEVILKTVPPVVGAATACCSVERSFAALDNSSARIFTVCYVKLVQRGQPAAWSDFKDRATAIMAGVVAACVCCPVDVPVDGLDQSPDGVLAVCAIALRTKGVKRRQFAAWGDLEDRARPWLPPRFVVP